VSSALKLTWSVNATPEEIEAALWGLCKVALVQLRERFYPPLYESGVVYRQEPLGREVWRGPRDVFRDGHGDCEDLVACRVGELWKWGRPAEPRCYSPRPGLIHFIVWTDRGLEDPSKRLGMGR
jgi:hypothetical protein